jgi:hypothetical protein
MALVAVLDQTFTDPDDFIDGASGMHATLLGAGWTLLDEIDAAAGQQDRVYTSTGESGDEALFLRATHDSANDRVNFRAYSWWDDTLHVGYNVIGDVAGNSCIQLVAAQHDAWLVADADAIAIVCNPNATTVYNKFFGGNLDRLLPTQLTELTKLAAPVGGWNGQGDAQLLVNTGTDFTKLAVDQYIWLVSQDDSAPTIVERVQILGLDAPTYTVFLTAALTYDFAIGTLLGSDAQPMVLWGDSNGLLSTATPLGLHSSTAYAQTSLAAVIPSLDVTANGHVPVYPLRLDDSVSDYLPGTCPFFFGTAGGLADEDDLVDGTTNYVVFDDGASVVALKHT